MRAPPVCWPPAAPSPLTSFSTPKCAAAMPNCSHPPLAVVVFAFLAPDSLMHWKTPPPTILFTHNVEAQVWERHYKVTTNPFMKTACWLESRALAGVERRYVELADHVLAVSENDRAFFLQYVDPSRVSVIPTGVDTEYF